LDHNDSLFGLYEGTPLGERGTGYHLALPDRITIYREPILEACATREEMKREIRLTVIHELGHHFGLTDAELPY
jgi:predicted Zn-dependent protease with MMP-like domain